MPLVDVWAPTREALANFQNSASNMVNLAIATKQIQMQTAEFDMKKGLYDLQIKEAKGLFEAGEEIAKAPTTKTTLATVSKPSTGYTPTEFAEMGGGPEEYPKPTLESVTKEVSMTVSERMKQNADIYMKHGAVNAAMNSLEHAGISEVQEQQIQTGKMEYVKNLYEVTRAASLTGQLPALKQMMQSIPGMNVENIDFDAISVDTTQAKIPETDSQGNIIGYHILTPDGKYDFIKYDEAGEQLSRLKTISDIQHTANMERFRAIEVGLTQSRLMLDQAKYNMEASGKLTDAQKVRLDFLYKQHTDANDQLNKLIAEGKSEKRDWYTFGFGSKKMTDEARLLEDKLTKIVKEVDSMVKQTPAPSGAAATTPKPSIPTGKPAPRLNNLIDFFKNSKDPQRDINLALDKKDKNGKRIYTDDEVSKAWSFSGRKE